MFESKSGVLLIGGLGFFLFAFLSNGVVPVLMYQDLPEKTADQLVSENRHVMWQFNNLKTVYPEAFEKYYGEANEENCVEALRLGRQVYIGEGCWHCHSQFVRPVSNESRRWGKVASTDEYQNELQRPVMFGTRRIGPDLSREGGRRSNDWHVAHFYKPTLVSPDSPMPEYPWLFDEAEITDDLDPEKKYTVHVPNKRGIALITYVQWLGSWLDTYPYYEQMDELNLDE